MTRSSLPRASCRCSMALSAAWHCSVRDIEQAGSKRKVTGRLKQQAQSIAQQHLSHASCCDNAAMQQPKPSKWLPKWSQKSQRPEWKLSRISMHSTFHNSACPQNTIAGTRKPTSQRYKEGEAKSRQLWSANLSISVAKKNDVSQTTEGQGLRFEQLSLAE